MLNVETLANNIKRTCGQNKLHFYGDCAVMNNIVVNNPTSEARSKISMLSSLVPEKNGDYEYLTGSMVAPLVDVLKKACEYGDDKILICFRSKIWGNYSRVYVASYQKCATTPTATATETKDCYRYEGDSEYFTIVLDAFLLARLCHNRKIDHILLNRNEKSIVLFFSGKYYQVPVTLLACYAGHPDNYQTVASAAKDMESLDNGAEVPGGMFWWINKKIA